MKFWEPLARRSSSVSCRSLTPVMPTKFNSLLCQKGHKHFSYILRDGLLEKYLIITHKKPSKKILHRNVWLSEREFFKRCPKYRLYEFWLSHCFEIKGRCLCCVPGLKSYGVSLLPGRNSRAWLTWCLDLKNNYLFPVTPPNLYFWLYSKSFYDDLNQKHGIPNEKHEQLNYEPTINH